ncbi:transposase [Nocardiopsis kunsanensis]|uniref:Transposase n=1 Tax=Nocardiopsis kunsanensis TaxID=141693 RepID=A0A918XCK3_9ACTN|nr:transposase [Nocardiopsis kunsanensis]GHD24720.1 transposase [Nocardiopsis kunsanensis]
MTNNLDALLTALYVHLDDDVIPSTDQPRRPGRPRLLTDAELVCVAVAQVLLRCDDDRLRLMDGTPVRCGASRTTVNRSQMGELAAYGRDISHHAFYWGAELILITTAEGTVCAFSLASPKELDERKQALHLLHVQPPATGPTPIVCDKGFAGAQTERAAAELGYLLIRPVRHDEPQPPAKVFPAWLRQRIEAIIWTLKNQLGLERHAARTTEGLWSRTCQRILALNAAIWHNWQIGAPVKRSLVAYDH